MNEYNKISFDLKSVYDGIGQYYIYNSELCDQNLLLSGTTEIVNGTSTINIDETLQFNSFGSIKFIDSRGCETCQSYPLTILVPCGEPITGTGFRGVYNLEMNLGTDVGVVLIRFRPVNIPDALYATYNNITYDEYSSPVFGYLKGFIGNINNNCNLPINELQPDLVETLNVFNFDQEANDFVSTGTQEEITVNHTDVTLTSSDPQDCLMVIPKTELTPTLLSLKFIGPCTSTAFYFTVNCPSLLPSFNSSQMNVNNDVCSLPTNNLYYFARTDENNNDIRPILHDWVFSDENGENKLSEGYYNLDNDEYIRVSQNGIVIQRTQCPIIQTYTYIWSHSLTFDGATSNFEIDGAFINIDDSLNITPSSNNDSGSSTPENGVTIRLTSNNSNPILRIIITENGSEVINIVGQDQIELSFDFIADRLYQIQATTSDT